MKILHYCQHVLGLGHLFRSLEIAAAFVGHEVVFVTGGPPINIQLPPNVRLVRLPPLEMGKDFGPLTAGSPATDLDAIKTDRARQLFERVAIEAPDVLLVELYPFGRKGFRFELDPVLEAIQTGRLPRARVVCSLRDILVEKDDQEKHEQRAVSILNRFFDAVLVHADPAIISLEKTFLKTAEIAIPLVYTGFVCPAAPLTARSEMRQELGLKATDRLILASAGGGKVGGRLLEAVLDAMPCLSDSGDIHLRMYAGPYLDRSIFERLSAARSERVRIRRFTDRFIAYLAAADVSVSMGGYNTCMNILATGTPSLVWPFPQNREQGLRAAALARYGILDVLTADDLTPKRLAEKMRQAVCRPASSRPPIRLDGAEKTAAWIEQDAANSP